MAQRLYSLAPVVGREQTITTIADALGLVLYSASDRAEQLIAALHAKQLLLVLDNFEHLLAETACVTLIGDLVRGAPRVKLLVTSREPLRLQAEWVFEVQGLPVPESAEPDALEASSAAQSVPATRAPGAGRIYIWQPMIARRYRNLSARGRAAAGD